MNKNHKPYKTTKVYHVEQLTNEKRKRKYRPGINEHAFVQNNHLQYVRLGPRRKKKKEKQERDINIEKENQIQTKIENHKPEKEKG